MRALSHNVARRDDGQCEREKVVFCRVIWKQTYTERGAQKAAPKEREDQRASSAPWLPVTSLDLPDLELTSAGWQMRWAKSVQIRVL